MAIRSVNLSDTIGELVTEFNLMGTDIGDISLLTTSDTSSIVGAIQSLDSDLRFDFGNALDSDFIIQLITDQTNLSSIFPIFNSFDFEIVNNLISVKDSDISFSSINTTNITFTNARGGNIDADSATFTGVINAQDFNSTSDISLKENIETLNNAISVLNNIRPVSFVWKEDGRLAYGVIAQEIEEVLPEIVDQDKHGIKRVAYSQIIPFLVQVIQEQHKEIQNIKAVLNLE